jgi:uncharacterized damage-inducible protein DinB
MDDIRALYAYSAWANARILDTADRLSDEQFSAAVGASFPSVHETLVHTLGAQRHWLYRWQNQTPPRFLEMSDCPDRASLRALWQTIEAQTVDFLADLDEALLDERIQYTTRSGQTFVFSLRLMLLHQALHAMQHRSEVAVMLTQFGHSPGDLDFLTYIVSLA